LCCGPKEAEEALDDHVLTVITMVRVMRAGEFEPSLRLWLLTRVNILRETWTDLLEETQLPYLARQELLSLLIFQ
jgi:hypothetical protein